jgi:hypothetical protein
MNKTVILDKDRNPYEQLYSHELEYLENFLKYEYEYSWSYYKSIYGSICNPVCCSQSEVFNDKKNPCKYCSSKLMEEWLPQVCYGFYLKKEFWLDVYKTVNSDDLKHYPPLKLLDNTPAKVKDTKKINILNKLKNLKINIYKCDNIYHNIYRVPMILKILEETPITKDVLNYVLKEYL